MTAKLRSTSVFFQAIMLVLGLGVWNTASAVIIEADFREELDLPFCCNSDGPRILERLGQTVPNAGFELGEADEIANPSAWDDSLQLDLDPTTNIVSLVSTDDNVYETINITISNILFSTAQEIVGFGVISSGVASTFENLMTSFTANSVSISYFGVDNLLDLGEEGATDTFQIRLGRVSTNPVPAPATLALFGLGLAGLGWSRRKTS